MQATDCPVSIIIALERVAIQFQLFLKVRHVCKVGALYLCMNL